MTTNNFVKSDLFSIYNIIQSSMMTYPKEMIISTLRNYFSQDSYYHYVKDEWGFAKTTDHTDLPLGQGLSDDSTTRLFIGENYRYDGAYYPAILVKNGSMKYVPISINRNKGTVKYDLILYQDGYGNTQTISRPVALVTAGVWEGSVIIDIMTKNLRSRDDLVQLIGMAFTEIYFRDLEKAGIVVKPLSIGAPSESDDRNDKMFKQSITLDIRMEWRREQPIGNLIDTIFTSVDFDNIGRNDLPPAANLGIKTVNSIY